METNERFTDGMLAQHPLFQGLSVEQRKKAFKVLERNILPAGQIIIREDEPGDYVYFLTQGVVRLFVQRGPNDVIIGIRGPGEIVGELSILDGCSRLATVKTQSPCIIFRTTGADFNNVLMEIKPFATNVTHMLAQRVRILTAQFAAMSTLSVQGRLARQLCLLADDYGTPLYTEESAAAIEIPFRLTQADLSHMIGATRVQVNQVFCQWKRNNIVGLHNSHLVVIDDATLRASIA